MMNILRKMLLAIMLVVASVKVSAQINELKQYVAEMNKSCPVALNAIMRLESIKYEDGFVCYNNVVGVNRQLFSDTFKGKKREEIINLADVLTNQGIKDLVELIKNANVGMKWRYKCIQSEDMVEAAYSTADIKACLDEVAKSPFNQLFGMEYINWGVEFFNDLNRKTEPHPMAYTHNGDISVKGNTLEQIILVPRKGIYKELDDNGVKTNRIALYQNIPQGSKLLSEMAKLNMSLIFILKDMHSSKSRKIVCSADEIKGYVK